MKSSIYLILSLTAALSISVSSSYAQNIDKSSKGGFALQAGTGITGLGVTAEYQFIVRKNIRMTPYGNIGISAGGTDTTTVMWFSSVAGFNVEYGQKHRIILGPQCLICYNFYTKPSDALVYRKSLAGPSFIIGYKGTAASGLIWQFSLGAVYLQNPLEADDKYVINPYIGAGLGYKFQ